MARMRKGKVLAIALGLIVVVLGVGAWSFLHVEAIPDELEPIDEAHDPAALVIPGGSGRDDLVFADFAGKTTVLVLEGYQSGRSNEGRTLGRALGRWTVPDATQVFVVGDAEGFGLFRNKIEKIMTHFAAEIRYPLYVDYKGDFRATFKLPQGHHAVVIIGPDGEILRRHSGESTAAELEEIRAMIGATEPPPGPPAPAFEVSGISTQRCRPCAIAFLDRPVARSDIPGVDGGFEGPDEKLFAQMQIPAIRIVASAMKMQLETDGLLVGAVRDVELPGWKVVEGAETLRQALDIPTGQAALVIIDDQGRVALRETGRIPLYKWGLAAEILGVEFNDKRPNKGAQPDDD